MYRYDSDTWKVTAVHGAAPEYAEYAQQGVKQPGPETVVARVARTKQIVHIADLAASKGYAQRDPLVVKAVIISNLCSVKRPVALQTAVLDLLLVERF